MKRYKIKLQTKNLHSALMKALANDGLYKEELVYEGSLRGAKKKASELFKYCVRGGTCTVVVYRIGGKEKFIKEGGKNAKWKQS